MLNSALKYIDDKREEIIKTLSELIAIKSIRTTPQQEAPFGKGNAEALEYMLEKAASLGLFTKNLDNYIGYAENRETEKPDIGILCHLDVVTVGGGWISDPFSADIREGKLYGRGATDNKGSAVAALYALAAANEFYLTNRSCRLILGCDEESFWEDIDYYEKHAKMPEFGFAPDAEFPVCNAEKGILQIVLESKTAVFDGISVAGGDRVNVVPDICKIDGTAGFFDIAKSFNIQAENRDNAYFVRGRSAHGSTPELGKNANIEALRLLSVNENICEDLRSLCQKLLSLFEDYNGGGLNIGFSDEPSGKLTSSLNILKIDENGFYAYIDIRYPVTADFNEIMRNIKNRTEGFIITVKKHRKPLYIPEETPFISCLKDAYSEITGEKTYCYSMGGGTFARTLPFGVAFGGTFPKTGDTCIHSANEFVILDDLITSAKIYLKAIVNLADMLDKQG